MNPTKALERVKPWWLHWRPTLHYLMQTEAHVYALAISACVLLSFYPFVMVMMSICRDVLHWPEAARAIFLGLKDFFAGEQGDFLVRNISAAGVPKLHFTTMFLLLFTANGIFEPLEVALNRAWGVKENRSYLKNQLISLGLIFACGGLALLSLILTALNSQWLSTGGAFGSEMIAWLERLFFKLAALPVSIFCLFLIYWLLPNRKVDPRRVAPIAIIVGLILEALKYVNLLLAPMLEEKFEKEYAIFRHSVTILVLSFVAALIVLAGAHFTASHVKEDEPLAREG